VFRKIDTRVGGGWVDFLHSNKNGRPLINNSKQKRIFPFLLPPNMIKKDKKSPSVFCVAT